MAATEQDQPVPEALRPETPTYQRRLGRNHSGLLNSQTEAALVWSGLVAGLQETDDPKEKRSFQDQAAIIQKWDPQEADFYTYLEDIRQRSADTIAAHNPGSIEVRLAQHRTAVLMAIVDSTRAMGDTLEAVSAGLGTEEARRAARVELINDWIDGHNEIVSPKKGDGPSDESQEKPMATPDVTSEKKEKLTSILDTVVDAAKDHTYIHTDTRPIPVRHGSTMKETDRTGFQTFGDAPDSVHLRHADFLVDRGTTEAVLFEPDTTTTYRTETYTVKTDLFGRQHTAERQVPSGEVPKMVTSHLTGESEPGIRVAYQFYANGIHYDHSKLPRYDTASGRPGNLLIIQTVLPQSLALEFKQAVQDSPQVSRAFAEAVMFNNGITEEAWKGGRAPMRPPYDKLPSDWTVAIADTQKYGNSHKVTSRQDVRVG